MKLIIIGNGFDLHHGYETSFKHFRKYLKQSQDFDDQDLVDKIDELIGNKNGLNSAILWNNFEAIAGDFMNRENSNVKDYEVIFEQFSQRFYEYLLGITKQEVDFLNKNLVQEFENANSILSFNYTSTFSQYLKNKQIDKFHIHGSLSNKNLPIIGFYYSDAPNNSGTSDYSLKYGGKLIHKAALAYKQNEINLDKEISSYIAKYKNKFTEVVLMGYSFGSSDEHIYKILNNILINPISERNVPISKAEKIQKIIFKVYSFKRRESNELDLN